MHSCGTEQRVSAELTVDSKDVTSSDDVNTKLKVNLSIPADYAMDVYVAPQENPASSVAGIIHSAVHGSVSYRHVCPTVEDVRHYAMLSVRPPVRMSVPCS